MLFWKELGLCQKQEVAACELLFALAIKLIKLIVLVCTQSDSCGPPCDSTPERLDQ